jgi:integrase
LNDTRTHSRRRARSWLGWTNHASGEGRLYTGRRRDKIWTLDDELAFLERAPKHLHLPLTLALWTGQRQGDQLKLTWSAYDGTHIRLKQSKTGVDAAVKQSRIILSSTDNKPWTADRFCSSWQKACKKADRRDLQRSSRNGTNKARNRGLHRDSNRRHHRSHDARGAVDSRRSLFTSRPSASRRSNQEARSENKLSQTSSQLGLRVLSRNRGKVQCDQLAGGLGFEPRLAESESAVLPLDDPPVFYC